MKAHILWLFFLFLTFLMTLPISWYGLAKADFFYPFLHDTIGIDQHIQRFAPLNNFNKLEFEKTSREQRFELFHGVVEAIHNDGNGLDSLAYTQKSTGEKITLFTEAEVTHLKDVAILLNKLKPIVLVLMIVWGLLTAWILFKRIKIPSTKRFLLYALILLFLTGLILSLGPERVFNQLHIWVFPDGHQWFFYYEDSLMSTMMMAPFLFAYIAGIWAILSIMISFLFLRLMHPIQSMRR